MSRRHTEMDNTRNTLCIIMAVQSSYANVVLVHRSTHHTAIPLNSIMRREHNWGHALRGTELVIETGLSRRAFPRAICLQTCRMASAVWFTR